MTAGDSVFDSRRWFSVSNYPTKTLPRSELFHAGRLLSSALAHILVIITKEKRFQQTPETDNAAIRRSQTVQKGVPDRRTSHSHNKSSSVERAEPAVRHIEKVDLTECRCCREAKSETAVDPQVQPR